MLLLLDGLDEVKEDRCKHLFNAYIDRMFDCSARSASLSFTKPQTLHYLSWLARTMIQHDIITYQIEIMQPSWLVERSQRYLYQLYVVLGGLFVGLLFGLSGGLTIGLCGVLLFALSGGVRDRITMVDKLKWSGNEAWSGLIYGLMIWLFVGLGMGIINGLTSEQVEQTDYPGQRLKQTLSNALSFTLKETQACRQAPAR